MERVKFTDLRRRISWGSIFAGVITVLAISFLLSMVATSIGFFKFDPLSNEPMSGIGTTVGIWTVISLIVSMAAGGFIAGKLAGTDGFIHGFLVWATTLIVAVVMLASLAVSAVKVTGNILGSVTSVAGSVVSGVGSAVGSGVSAIADQAENVFGDIDLSDDMNATEVRQDVRQALRKSGVKEFQPEYLRNQMNGVRSDLKRSVKRLVTNPNDADVVINRFLDRLQTRTDKAFRNVDRDDLTRAIANNSSLSQAEVNKAVDEYTILIENGIEKGKEQVENLKASIEQAKQDWQELKQNALVEADKVSNAAGRSTLFSFFAILIAAVLCAFAGSFGTRKTLEGYEV